MQLGTNDAAVEGVKMQRFSRKAKGQDIVELKNLT
jgi:hypothetical protein